MNEDNPLVSVGIPTYNRPEGLWRTLECITGQTYRNLEIIISDNCSPGTETERVVRYYLEKDSRIKYYRQKKNRGIGFNFQFVLKMAKGDYYMWASDDDEWYPQFIERCIGILLSNNQIITCSTNVVIISDTSFSKRDPVNRSLINREKKWASTQWISHEDIHTCFLSPIKRVKKYILNSGINFCFYGIHQRKILSEIYFSPDFKILKTGADRFLIARINLLGFVYQIQEPLFIYHHGLGASCGNMLNVKNKISRWQYYGLRINPLLTAYLNMIIDSLSWPVSITDHIRVVGYYLARMAKAKYMRYTMKTPFFGTPLYDYKPPEYPKRE